ncbi:AbrB family transcriptional regulator [Streptomyces sp. MspMP-M5]|uniref:AbrB family transcriptional regulator n=1 Tax=unclassified Streptomyces TaxID=2593676 RepID=UPI00131A0586|nr:AbrB family transcriptional regulator [Streptomyces sp. MspMP-M5]MYT32989.1 AbrB family transcriptional regulator [Streptomyces sp. SID8354]
MSERLVSWFRDSRGSPIEIVAISVGILAVSAALEPLGAPAPQLLLGLLVGAVIALRGKQQRRMSKSVDHSVQALIGVMIGAFLQISVLRDVAGAMLPLTMLTLVTTALSVGIAVMVARTGHMDRLTATLGMIAGGSAAVTSCAKDMGADSRVVAFMQYTRVAVISAAAPLVALLIAEPAVGGETADGGAGGAGWSWALVPRGDQLAGISITLVLASVGMRLARRIGLPSAALLGPMLLSALVTALGLTHGYSPAGLFKQMLLVLVGLEVGLRFDRETVHAVKRMIPLVLGAIVLLSGVIGGIAVGLAPALGVSRADAYLATTPGGINAVLASASTSDAHLGLISSVQTLRLFLMVLLLPLLQRWLSRSSAQRTTETAQERRESPEPEPTPVGE